MKLTSPAFEDGEYIPEKYGYPKENINPPLSIEDVPEKAESLVLIVDDPDAEEPAGKIWDHWVMWNIPVSTEEIGEDEAPGVEGTSDYDEVGYGGPNPPDGTHTYRFRLYAVDTELELDSDAGKDEVLKEIDDNVVEEAHLQGKYDPI